MYTIQILLNLFPDLRHILTVIFLNKTCLKYLEIFTYGPLIHLVCCLLAYTLVVEFFCIDYLLRNNYLLWCYNKLMHHSVSLSICIFVCNMYLSFTSLLHRHHLIFFGSCPQLNFSSVPSHSVYWVFDFDQYSFRRRLTSVSYLPIIRNLFCGILYLFPI